MWCTKNFILLRKCLVVQILYYHQILILLIFLLFHGKIWVCRLSFFKTLLILKVNHFSGFYLIEDYLKDIRSKFHATVTPQSRVMTLFFKHDYSAHPPALLSRSCHALSLSLSRHCETAVGNLDDTMRKSMKFCIYIENFRS